MSCRVGERSKFKREGSVAEGIRESKRLKVKTIRLLQYMGRASAPCYLSPPGFAEHGDTKFGGLFGIGAGAGARHHVIGFL